MIMRLRAMFVVMAALAVAAPAPAGDFDKYLSEDTQFFVQVNVPKFFTSEMVRKAVPMAFEKFGDQIVAMMGMARNFNPQIPEIPEDDAKKAMKKAADPQVIATIFDQIKGAVTDIVIAGKAEGEIPQMAILIKSEFIKAEMVDGIANMARATGQVELDAIKKDKGTIYAITAPQQPGQKVYMTVPEPGVLHISMSEKQAESSFAPKGKPSEKLSKLMNKKAANDFIFVAGLGGDGSDYSDLSGSLVLDKDISGKMAMSYKDETKAAEQAKMANEHLSELLDRLKMMLGDKADAFKPHLEKTKAVAQGKTVTSSVSIPGTVVEKLLEKD
jgi:hypothetical protein